MRTVNAPSAVCDRTFLGGGVTAKQVVFLVTSDAYEQRLRLGLWALSAASVGEAVHVMFVGNALRSWCEGRFDQTVGEQDSRSALRASELGLLPPSAMLKEARELSPVRIVSCGTEVLLAGLTEEAARPHLDDLVSLPSFWRETAGARVVTL